jgi:hypothetical protein
MGETAPAQGVTVDVALSGVMIGSQFQGIQ